MNLNAVKTLAQNHTSEELFKMADEFEATGVAPVPTSDDPGEQMSDYLQAAEIRASMDAGLPLQEAIREFAVRVRGVLK